MPVDNNMPSEATPREHWKVNTARLATQIQQAAQDARSEEDLKMRVEPLLQKAFSEIGVDVERVEYEKRTALKAKVARGFHLLGPFPIARDSLSNLLIFFYHGDHVWFESLPRKPNFTPCTALVNTALQLIGSYGSVWLHGWRQWSCHQ